VPISSASASRTAASSSTSWISGEVWSSWRSAPPGLRQAQREDRGAARAAWRRERAAHAGGQRFAQAQAQAQAARRGW
jgi:hypothetical protein